jgi:lipopolysaccharide biosynthesis protein
MVAEQIWKSPEREVEGRRLSALEPSAAQTLRLIAFYLPQFHPIPENDEWWGKGFTEWTNVVRAKPLFRGHYQPHVPADLGFYDLRLPEARSAQADLARDYGLHGFCYYHYWFGGKRLLEQPFDEVLASGKPDFPFCLCWANESWTRNWDGQNEDILIKQQYGGDDDRRHIAWLVKAFRDERYIRHDGKPLFLVYRASNLPNPLATTNIWREEARRAGIGELFLCRVESSDKDKSDPVKLGFDSSIEFQPDWMNLGPPIRQGPLWFKAQKLGLINPTFGSNRVYDYRVIVDRMLKKTDPPYERIPCVTPSWDNSARRSPRRRAATIFMGATPDLYETWLRTVVRKGRSNGSSPFVFINAWNEWGEGNHLEPCQKWGRAFLEATRQALQSAADVGMNRLGELRRLSDHR